MRKTIMYIPMFRLCKFKSKCKIATIPGAVAIPRVIPRNITYIYYYTGAEYVCVERNNINRVTRNRVILHFPREHILRKCKKENQKDNQGSSICGSPISSRIVSSRL